MKPLVSILIPTWNRKPLVVRAVRFALKQTYSNVEVVVYDDGSTDGTDVALREIQDKRIRYIRSTDNRGPSVARNALLKHMKGEYGCWLDSDDLCSRWRVQLQMDAMLKWSPPFVRTAFSIHDCRKHGNWWKQNPQVLFCKRQVVATSLFQRKCVVAFDESIEAGGEDVLAEMEMVRKHGIGMVIPFDLYQIDRRKSWDWATRVSKWVRVKDVKMAKKVARSKVRYHARYDALMVKMRDEKMDSGMRAEYVPACKIDVPTGLVGPNAWAHGMRKLDWRKRSVLPSVRCDLSSYECPGCAANGGPQ